MPDILVVDDEADIRELVSGILEDEGYSVRTAADSHKALAAIRARQPALLIQDIWMQGGGLDGLELLDLVKDARRRPARGHDQSGHGNIETAVSAIKRGAYDFLEKPFKADRLLLVTERAHWNRLPAAAGEPTLCEPRRSPPMGMVGTQRRRPAASGSDDRAGRARPTAGS